MSDKDKKTDVLNSLDGRVVCEVSMSEGATDNEGDPCGRPAKFKIPKDHAFAGRVNVCGIHARSYNAMAERLGWEKAQPIADNDLA
jgi:hypothetical protein